MFGLGHCAVVGVAGFSSTWVQRCLDWQNETPGAKWLRRGCGLLVLVAGAYFVFSARGDFA
jgi:cytochrome c-type biogenesis protein